MNTMLLQYAVEVEKTGSITQAAGNLGMDQPNLSKAIKSLEESLGAPVFKRTSKGVVPTANGMLFLEHAKVVLVQMKEIELLYKPAPFAAAKFSISVPRSSYISLAFSRFAARQDKSVERNLWFRETNTSETLRDVESGEYRLGMIVYPVTAEKYFSQMISKMGLTLQVQWEYHCRILMSKMHPLAAKEQLSCHDLKPYHEIIPGDADLSSTRAQDEKGRVYVFERGSQFELLSEDRDTYMWVSPVPERLLHIHGFIQKKCAEDGRIYREALVYRKGFKLGGAEKQFIEVLNQVRAEL